MSHEQAKEWTLTEAARLLGEPQHRLIYLCEKGAVRPDFQDAGGRGSSRRFSARNLLELAVALRLREFEIQVSLVAAVLHVLRAFEIKVGKQIPDFRLPESLRVGQAPDMRAIIGDRQRLYFSLQTGATPPKLFGGISLMGFEKPDEAGNSQLRMARLSQVREADSNPSEFGGPEGSRHARVEVSITRIAQDLPLGD